ncbi:hypothetical protein [Streptomyces sp. NPDC056987]|uniref:hypothetical protein n=1 Tax=Streptomyces sp. NPDC056987 TaxID=3345988 RepID=UPI003633028E
MRSGAEDINARGGLLGRPVESVRNPVPGARTDAGKHGIEAVHEATCPLPTEDFTPGRRGDRQRRPGRRGDQGAYSPSRQRAGRSPDVNDPSHPPTSPSTCSSTGDTRTGHAP